jgi:hypothetical protein
MWIVPLPRDTDNSSSVLRRAENCVIDFEILALDAQGSSGALKAQRDLGEVRWQFDCLRAVVGTTGGSRG